MSGITLLVIIGIFVCSPIAYQGSVKKRRWWAGVLTLCLIFVMIFSIIDVESGKVVRYSLLPLGLVWLGLISIMSFSIYNGRYQYATLVASLMLVIWFGGNQWIGAQLMASLERRVDASHSNVNEKYDCVCVLGGGSNRRFDGRPQLGDTADRLRVGALMYKEQRTGALLTTGYFAPDTKRLWRDFGIPDEVIIVDRAPVNTAEEILTIKRLSIEREWTSIGVVSSSWHLPRVMKLAKNHGVHLVPLPADWRGAFPPWTAALMVPKAEGLLTVERALKEHVGLLFSN